METIIGILVFMVVAVSIIGWLWIVVTAFSDGETLWGIGCLIISPLCIVYGILNYQELKIPFYMVLGGIIGRIGFGTLAVMLS